MSHGVLANLSGNLVWDRMADLLGDALANLSWDVIANLLGH